MIYFGVPEFTSDNDHDVRCVKMAMKMQKKMEITFVQSVHSAPRGLVEGDRLQKYSVTDIQRFSQALRHLLANEALAVLHF